MFVQVFPVFIWDAIHPSCSAVFAGEKGSVGLLSGD